MVVTVGFFSAFNCFLSHGLSIVRQRCGPRDTRGGEEEEGGREGGRGLLQSPPKTRMRLVHDFTVGFCMFVSARTREHCCVQGLVLSGGHINNNQYRIFLAKILEYLGFCV